MMFRDKFLCPTKNAQLKPTRNDPDPLIVGQPCPCPRTCRRGRSMLEQWPQNIEIIDFQTVWSQRFIHLIATNNGMILCAADSALFDL